jgi:hypothetical protein
MIGVVPGGVSTRGPETTVSNSSAKETEGVRGRDLREVTTGTESPVGAERAQTVACRTEGVKVSGGI